MARSHVSFAMTWWWLYCLGTGQAVVGLGTLFAGIGGLLPDLDHPKSVLGRKWQDCAESGKSYAKELTQSPKPLFYKDCIELFSTIFRIVNLLTLSLQFKSIINTLYQFPCS